MARDLDTNILIRWLIRDNLPQTEKVDKLLSSGEVFEVSDMTISEMVFVLSKFYTLNTDTICECISKIISHRNIKANKILFEKVLFDYTKSPNTSFLDVCLAHYAGLHDAKLLTFDKTLAKKLPKLVELV